MSGKEFASKAGKIRNEKENHVVLFFQLSVMGSEEKVDKRTNKKENERKTFFSV